MKAFKIYHGCYRLENRKSKHTRIIFLVMDLPINDSELATIVGALRLGGDASLYQKLKLVKEIREENPNGPYKKILREQYGMVA